METKMEDIGTTAKCKDFSSAYRLIAYWLQKGYRLQARYKNSSSLRNNWQDHCPEYINLAVMEYRPNLKIARILKSVIHYPDEKSEEIIAVEYTDEVKDALKASGIFGITLYD